MFRTRFFWIGFALASLLALVFSVRYFATAFPLLSVDVRMDRDAALSMARDLAQQHAWPPEAFDQAVSFGGDQEVQNFIELEGGGKAELAGVLREGLYSPYKWVVRHFKEGDAHETLSRFTPEGKPYGFVIRLPEKEAGASLDVDAALELARSSAQRDWQVNLVPYQLLESSKQVRPGGRTDHTFVFERWDARLQEGRYRLRLVVAGDKLTELTHFVQVPEAFSRRYAEMRSRNDSISAVATFGVLVYLIGFVGVGLFFMTRQRWVIWKQPILWAVLIAALAASDTFNMWSLVWMDYDTALPSTGFALRQAASAFGLFTLMAVLLSVSFMAAETLSRRAFPHHYQFWRLWSRPVASSTDVLGMTAAGYLLVAIFFAYDIGMYLFANSKLGWWTPSDTLVNPNIFGAYLPSLSAIANSAQAGFWEESLFRAVPLAIAALIGDRFKKRRLFIIGMMIVQALVFGSGHAGYANQPAYARVVELIIPSFAFGALYLAFGLLPGIILHYAFDLVWFAIPIFVSSAPRALIEQAIIILIGFLPLGIVLYQRYKSDTRAQEYGPALNKNWQPPPIEEPVVSPAMPGPEDVSSVSISANVRRLLPVAGAAGLLLWITVSSFKTDAPPIRTSLSDAETAAREALAKSNIHLDGSWRAMPFIVAQPDAQHRFVWQRAGRDAYRALLGSYLPIPRWNVRFARFEGDVAARAEEYVASVDGNGQVLRTYHQLPEAAPGANLTEEQARAPAREYILEKYDLPPDKISEISAQASKRPARTDWDFVFRDTRDYKLPEGETRINVSLAGNEITYSNRFVHIPEEWARDDRARRNIPTLITIACSAAGVLIVLMGAVIATISWSRTRAFSIRAFVLFMALLFVLGVIGMFNGWPAFGAQLQTAQPYSLQIAILAGALAIGTFCVSLAFGLVAGYTNNIARPQASLTAAQALLLAVSFGAVVAGIAALAARSDSANGPDWSGYGPAGTLVPFVAASLQPLESFLKQTLILGLVFGFVGKLRRLPAAVLLLVVGLVFSGSDVESVSSWLLSGIAVGVILILGHTFLLRRQPALLPLAMGTIGILSTLKAGLRQTYPAVLPGSILASLLIAIAAWLWFSNSEGLSKCSWPAGHLRG